MTHLEFTYKLNKLGLSFRNSGNIERNNLIISESECRYKVSKGYQSRDAFEKAIIEAIDMDEWKNSIHFEICPENYSVFQDIIMDKILDRAEDIQFLLKVYFLINRKLAE